MKKFLVTLAAAATFLGGAFAIAVWSPIGTAGAEETNLKHHPGIHQRDGMKADRGEHFASIAEVLGVEVEELREQLAGGSTLAEIAGDNVDAVVALLVENATERINEAVAAEKITQEEAAEKIAGLEEVITEKINTSPGELRDKRPPRKDGMKADRGEHFASIAELLGLEVEDLRSQLAEGATMAEIAGDNVDALIAVLVDDATEKINEAVAAEKMTQEEADEKIASLEENITERVNTAPKGLKEKRPPRGKQIPKGPRVSIQPVPNAAIQNLSEVSVTAA